MIHFRPDRGMSFYAVSGIIIVLVFLAFVYYQFDTISGSVSAISCSYSKRTVDKALINYYNKTKTSINFVSELYKPVKLYILYQEKLLNYVPVCPQQGVYKADENGAVYCSFHNRIKESKF